MSGLRVRDLAGRRIVIWGYGVEGRAALRMLKRHAPPSELVVVVDDPATVTPDTGHGEDPVDVRRADDVDFARFEVIVKSPGVSPYHGTLAEIVRAQNIELTGGTALWFAETGGDRVVAVTGSKGKSTTTSLVAHLLEAFGHPATLAGNVGRALLDVLDDDLTNGPNPEQLYAVETSSFQAAEVRHSPQVGVLTALFPEHLDWHGSVERYFDDKCNLFAHRPDIVTAANTDNAAVRERFATLVNGRPFGAADGLHFRGTLVCRPDGSALVDTATSMLPGRHNAINLAGALTAIEAIGVEIDRDATRLQQAVDSFRPLAHRLEPVGELGGRLVVDDSLSTAPEAAVAALAAFPDRPVAIIVGGHDRGLDYTTLASAIAARTTPTWVCGVPLSGERIVPLIERTMAAVGTDPAIVRVRAFDDFDAAVHHAVNCVPEGGVVLLSPAAPSFGRFRNYAERGMHFRALLGL